jgi:uncharacterized protein YndB with AHSA1/START domain
MARRVRAQWVVQIARPPADVFAYLADIGRHHEWSPKQFRVEGLPDGAVHKGTTYTSWGWVPGDSNHRNDVEVTEFAPPSVMTLVARENGETFVNTFELSADDAGTKLVRTMDMPRPGGVVGAVFPLLVATIVKPGVSKGLRMLKANVEGGVAGH